MCSSSNGMSPFAQVSPFWNWNPSSSFWSLNDDDHLDLLHHHQDLHSYCLAVAPIIDAETAAVSASTKKMTSAPKSDRLTAVSVLATPTNSSKEKKATAKRDQHSKILTAQGPRDRRVRLSIEISRKFFGLQDLLGFDKASSTLDWLLTKSKTDIRELIQTKQMDNDAINATCLLSSLSEDDNNNGAFVAEGDSERKKRNSTKKEKPKLPTAADIFAKEARAKARERARERTREKNSLRLRILCQQHNNNLTSFNSSYQMGTFCRSTTNSSTSSSNEITTTFTDEGFFLANINPRNVAGESAARNMKTSKSNCLQRNLIEEGSSDFNNYWPVDFSHALATFMCSN